jgi:hypothetical protein
VLGIRQGWFRIPEEYGEKLQGLHKTPKNVLQVFLNGRRKGITITYFIIVTSRLNKDMT